MSAADEYGRQLPAFDTLEQARTALFDWRDQALRTLVEAAERSASFPPDYRPESLKALERWYFELFEGPGFESIGMTRADFECCLAIYFGEVLVRHQPPFEWVVEPFAFDPSKYELGVSRPLTTLMLGRFKDLHARANNKRRQSLWRRYLEYAD